MYISPFKLWLPFWISIRSFFGRKVRNNPNKNSAETVAVSGDGSRFSHWRGALHHFEDDERWVKISEVLQKIWIKDMDMNKDMQDKTYANKTFSSLWVFLFFFKNGCAVMRFGVHMYRALQEDATLSRQTNHPENKSRPSPMKSCVPFKHYHGYLSKW